MVMDPEMCVVDMNVEMFIQEHILMDKLKYITERLRGLGFNSGGFLCYNKDTRPIICPTCSLPCCDPVTKVWFPHKGTGKIKLTKIQDPHLREFLLSKED